MDPNVAAFLAMLSHSEGTDRAPDPYRVCFGGEHTIDNLANHPAITGEWKGARLPDHMCINIGLAPGCISTAAGKYQIIRPTWARLQQELNLPDFAAPSQDAAAVQLVRERGAYDLIVAGNLAAAIPLCSGVWASLPGSTAGQPTSALAALVLAYGNAGGSFA